MGSDMHSSENKTVKEVPAGVADDISRMLVYTQGVAKQPYKRLFPYIRIVTFNVRYGEKTGEIVKVLQENKNLKHADVILFQEIESHEHEKISRTEAIAAVLDMHYV